MRSASALQQWLAEALVTGAPRGAAPALVGGTDPRGRLTIHLRHYAASLTAALMEKFPATRWLAGDEFMRAAALAYVRAQPPRTPCIAEYGAGFPRFVGRAELTRPYLEAFATLERAVAQASIAVSEPALAWPELTSLSAEALLDRALVLQPGVRYVRSAWRVDSTMRAYLAGGAPPMLAPAAEETCIEVRGARGEVAIERLDAAAFTFRAALAAGETIGAAAERALDADASFDAGQALARLVAAGLAVRLCAGAAAGVERPA